MSTRVYGFVAEEAELWVAALAGLVAEVDKLGLTSE